MESSTPVPQTESTVNPPLINGTSIRQRVHSLEDPDEDCVNVFGDEDLVERELKDESLMQKMLISHDLLEQEQKVKFANAQEAKAEAEDTITAPHAQSPAQEPSLSREDRYKKLMDLLGRSTFYSQFLLKKMQDEDEASKLKEQKLAERKKLKMKLVKETKAKPNRGRKRKQDAEKHEAKEVKEDGHPVESNGPAARAYQGEDIPDEQPLLLTGGVMRDYQVKGYQWMATLFENGINGILADEMGLGKTIQTIALFCHLIEMGVPGPFLVVAPLSTVPNWVKEFQRFAPQIPVTLYHGSPKERIEKRLKLKENHVIEGIPNKVKSVFVTSFEIAMNDRVNLRHVNWRYIVVDEGHRLKNTNCRLIKELRQYQSVNRLLLTGTPLQNNLAELWSLLNFLMAEIFDDLRVFESWFDAKDMDQDTSESDRILMQEKQNNILSTLHQILTPFLLRRVKADVDLKIPPKKEVLVYCPMTSKQKGMYENIVTKTLKEHLSKNKEIEQELEVNKIAGRGMRKKHAVDYKIFLDEGVSAKKLEAIVESLNKKEAESSRGSFAYNVDRLSADVRISFKNSMMDLRKATNHPYLIEYPYTECGNFYRSDQEMIDVCGKLKVFDQLLQELVKRGHKILIFSQMTKMLDILGDYLELKKYKFSRLDGSMQFEDRQANIDSFNEDPSVNVFLLSTRAGGLGINLTAADTCIIYDSDWNPQQDLQAQDRCHRIGQTKPVMVYRLVTANTIDQRIVERAAAKRKLEKLIIHSKKFKSQDNEGLKKTMEAISPQELLELLQSEDHAGVIDREEGAILSQDELDLLLDRSDLTWKNFGERSKKVKRDQIKTGNSQVRSEGLFKVVDTEGIPTGLSSIKED
ncbi:hypothetical protein TCAL_10825 [Tigriopus californicus]|uniref:Proliferation-associated SNF2-like protein n=1 Tax=Tigriopus californicus TaxID=6832 RepID=A0A553NCI8_TIGCA|nr:lymphocyte-specific helicase-like [Tigriopus californicus]TRY63163.1 hypothetical protein TCAL_10825 [Tigriopus californicus]|eukprot:TCALIF_10825-PA protein Name:"Similar to Hells Lymphocyte-specific helicase (Mus musculus)" AED:0.03 eAED:0.03 QI:36/1/1/1/1/1/5/66/862